MFGGLGSILVQSVLNPVRLLKSPVGLFDFGVVLIVLYKNDRNDVFIVFQHNK